MYADVDVFISNYTLVDPEIYQLWIEGYSCKFNQFLAKALELIKNLI